MGADPTIIIAISLLVIYFVLVFFNWRMAVTGKNLNPLQMQELSLMLDGKTCIIEGGNWLDNFIVYCRNGHPILSIFFPTSYNPIQGSERVGILFMLAVASVGLESLKNIIWDDDHFMVKILLVSTPVLIVDFLLNYLATREDKAILERSKDKDAEWGDDEKDMRNNNVTFMVRTYNERAIVNKTVTSASCGQWGFKGLMLVCLVLLVVFGLSGVSGGWLSSWLYSFVLWIVYALPLFFVKYCREDPFAFVDPDAKEEDLPSVAEIEDLTQEQVIEYVNEWSTHQCCYGQEGGSEIDFISAVGSVTKKIEFVSWSEARWKQSKEDDYQGDYQIGYHEPGPEPEIWDVNTIPMHQATPWEDCQLSGDVPGTLQIVECDRCNGSGKVTEKDAEGNETEKTCPKCKGSGKLKRWKICIAFFGTREQHECLDVSACPVYAVEAMTGKQTECVERDREQEDFFNLPNMCGDPHFAEPLYRFHQNHLEIENNYSSRIDKQKFCIQMIPLWEVKYNYNDEEHRFWILGEEHDVHWPAKEYSTRCCHCCNCFDCNNLGKPKYCVDWC